MNLIELLDKAKQLQEQINTPDANVEELSKELESIMNEVYDIIDDDKNWIEVTPSELEELNNEETE
jgi:regulator of replication initiation timing